MLEEDFKEKIFTKFIAVQEELKSLNEKKIQIEEYSLEEKGNKNEKEDIKKIDFENLEDDKTNDKSYIFMKEIYVIWKKQLLKKEQSGVYKLLREYLRKKKSFNVKRVDTSEYLNRI